MIVFSKPFYIDWPDFWDNWLTVNNIFNPNKSYIIESIKNEFINYKVCHNCGKEYAIIFEKSIDNSFEFRCDNCNKIVKPLNYKNKICNYNLEIGVID